VGADQGIGVLVGHDGRYDGDAHDDKGGCDSDQPVRLGLGSTAGSGEANAEHADLSQPSHKTGGTAPPSWTPGKLCEKGAILRREGLYSSLISEWRRARDAGALAGLKQPRGRPAADPRDAQIARLRKEKAKLEQELAKARFVVDVQSKLQALLETISESADNEPGPSS
jgi:hypothetical protein